MPLTDFWARFAQVSAVECGPYDYTRSGNPTRAQLEAHMADLEARSHHWIDPLPNHHGLHG